MALSGTASSELIGALKCFERVEVFTTLKELAAPLELRLERLRRVYLRSRRLRRSLLNARRKAGLTSLRALRYGGPL
jgi:hypothetical protein